MGGKLLSGIKNMYVDSLACVRVKGGGGSFCDQTRSLRGIKGFFFLLLFL